MVKIFCILLVQILANSFGFITQNDKVSNTYLPFAELQLGNNNEVIIMYSIEKLQEKKYHRLTVIAEGGTSIDKYGKPNRLIMCKCDCGKISNVKTSSLLNGNTKSCGCMKLEASARNGKISTPIHGLSKTSLYQTWADMKRRCYNKNHKEFHLWGGRGIIVCSEWLNNPKEFIEWSLKNNYRKGLQLDRTNNDGNYEPNNCRFVTPAINSRNSRRTKLTQSEVYEIRESNSKNYIIAIEYNVDRSVISKIRGGKIWRQ